MGLLQLYLDAVFGSFAWYRRLTRARWEYRVAERADEWDVAERIEWRRVGED